MKDKNIRETDIWEKSDAEIDLYVRNKLHYNAAVNISGTFSDFSTLELHSHPYHQMLVIPRGVSLLIDEESSQALFGAQCAIIPAGVRHRSVVVGSEITYHCLYIRKKEFVWSENTIKIFSMSALGRALYARIGLSDIVRYSDYTAKTMLDLLFRIVLEDIAQKGFSIKLPVPKTDAGAKIISFIEKSFRKDISLEDFKNVLPLSTRQMSRLFIADCGITIIEYLRVHRLLVSSIMLSSRKEILDTAFACGYRSISSFFADFKRYFGVSPSRFRKMTKMKD